METNNNNGNPSAQLAVLKDWRKTVVSNLEKIDNRLGEIEKKIRCDVHVERMSGMQKQINWLWSVSIGVILIGVVFGVWVKAVAG